MFVSLMSVSQKLSVFFASIYFAWQPGISPLPSPTPPPSSPPIVLTAEAREDVCYRNVCAPADSRLGAYLYRLINTSTEKVQTSKPIPSATPTPSPAQKPVDLTPTQTPESITSPSPTTQQSPTTVPTQQPIQPTNTPAPQEQNVSNLTLGVNEYRSNRGISKLNERADICALAKQRAIEAKSNFSHEGFERRIAEGSLSSLGYSGIAENLWQGNPVSVDRIVSSWEGSDGHRQNMDGEWTHGCGAIEGDTAAFIFFR